MNVAALVDANKIVVANKTAAVMETPTIIPSLEALGGYSYQYYYLFVLVEMVLAAVEMVAAVVVQQMDVVVVSQDAKLKSYLVIERRDSYVKEKAQE